MKCHNLWFNCYFLQPSRTGIYFLSKNKWVRHVSQTGFDSIQPKFKCKHVQIVKCQLNSLRHASSISLVIYWTCHVSIKHAFHLIGSLNHAMSAESEERRRPFFSSNYMRSIAFVISVFDSTDPFKILEPRHPPIDEFYDQEHVAWRIMKLYNCKRVRRVCSSMCTYVQGDVWQNI